MTNLLRYPRNIIVLGARELTLIWYQGAPGQECILARWYCFTPWTQDVGSSPLVLNDDRLFRRLEPLHPIGGERPREAAENAAETASNLARLG